jgi:hypothetical protein
VNADGEMNASNDLNLDESVGQSLMAVENGPGSGVAQALVTPDGEPPPSWRKIGIDANQPIDPQSGEIRVQVADPDIIASTGTRWVRLNFILGPWEEPLDETLHDGRTWAETYGQIISGFREKELKIYGLIGVEAMPSGPGDRFREPAPQGDVDDAWIELYAQQFVAIVQMFRGDIQLFESFNEPDDWHGARRNWVHPTWFAIMLQKIYSTVRSSNGLKQVRIVSGPLQGLEGNNNAAVGYLQDTYRAGKARFGWGQEGIPFPFDGVGYHLYVKHAFTRNQGQQDRAIRTACRQYLDAMHKVIHQEEGQDRPLYVSEIGWTSNVESWLIQQREQFQANCLRTGLAAVLADPLVALGFWFCTHDFRVPGMDQFFGLYRTGEPGDEARKPAFQAFRALCEPVVAPGNSEHPYTNQQMINAFYHAAVDLGLQSRWSLMKRAGLSLSNLAANRQAIYGGPPPGQLPNLTQSERAALLAWLSEQVGGQHADLSWDSASGAVRSGDKLPSDSLDRELALDLTLALQEEILHRLDRTHELLARVLEHVESTQFPARSETQVVSRLRRLRPSSLDGRPAQD